MVFSVSEDGGPRSTQLRGRIVRTAADLFFSRGFVHVTADDIAGRLGISKATLYKAFASKEGILRAAVRGFLREVSQRVEGILSDPKMGFVEKLAVLFAYVGDMISRFGPLFVRDIQKAAPRVWREIDDFRRDKIFENFRAVLGAGRREGLFRGDVDEDLLLQMFAFLIGEFINPEAILRSGRSPAEAFESVIKVFFQGILTDRGRRDFSARTPRLFEPRKEDAS
jgi:AcrR family transcriptional regulator